MLGCWDVGGVTAMCVFHFLASIPEYQHTIQPDDRGCMMAHNRSHHQMCGSVPYVCDLLDAITSHMTSMPRVVDAACLPLWLL